MRTSPNLLERHRSSGAEVTITLAAVENPSNYGLVETDKNGWVKRFVEKPSPDLSALRKLNTVNAGIYVLEPSVRDLIPADENRSFEYHIFPDLLTGRRQIWVAQAFARVLA